MAKTIKTGILHREATFDRAAVNIEKRTVDLSFSSELPVERYFGIEILDHSEESVDLSRLNNSAPLLLNHNRDDQIGVIESANISDKKGRATVRFGSSQRAQEIFKDVQDGIRSLVSVGYRINTLVNEKVEKGVETMRATSWTPMEISIVSIPADPTIGIGRAASVDERQFETRVEDPNKIMPNELSVTPLPSPAPTPTPGLEARQLDHFLTDDVREIRAMVAHFKAKYPEIEHLGAVAEVGKWPLSRFREAAVALIESLTRKDKDQSTTLGGLDIKPRDLAKYSISRAIMSQCSRDGLTGIERELNDEIRNKYKAEPQGVWIPKEALVANMARTYVAGTGTLGGMIVQTSNLGDQFIELLRNKAQVMALGARILTLSTPVTIPRQAGAGTANWINGETAASTLSAGNFQQVTLTPKGLGAFCQYSKQLLATNDPSIDGIVRDDITAIIGLAIDLAALHGSGASGQPTGIIGTTGIGSVLLATDGLGINNTTAYPAMVSLETLVSSANADMGSLGYLMRPATRGALRVAQRFSSTDSPVWTNYVSGPGVIPGNGSNDGIVNGYRAAVSSQVANNLTTGTATTITSPVFFGNWNELLIGQFNGGATDLVVDPYTAGANAVIRIYARHWIDIGVRHGASFAVLGGIIGV